MPRGCRSSQHPHRTTTKKRALAAQVYDSVVYYGMKNILNRQSKETIRDVMREAAANTAALQSKKMERMR